MIQAWRRHWVADGCDQPHSLLSTATLTLCAMGLGAWCFVASVLMLFEPHLYSIYGAWREESSLTVDARVVTSAVWRGTDWSKLNDQLTFGRLTAAELSHLADVRRVVRWLQFGGILGVVGLLLMAAVVGPLHLVRASKVGFWLALGGASAMAVVALYDWRSFFTAVHAVLFPAQTWSFPASHSYLLALFPREFWPVAAFAAVGGALALCWGLHRLAAAWRAREALLR